LAPTDTIPVVASLYPLDEFYAQRGPSAPPFTRIEPEEMPQPQRSLLAHQSDMTSTLEQFYRQRLHVEVLARHTVENEYGREVALRLDQDGRRVEYGAIKIFLDVFPAQAREEVLRERLPLGRILSESGVAFSSRPRLYFCLTADDFINRALGLSSAQVLYGRCNILVDPWDRPLAEIVEILPPA
jgi:hypothetical protein